LPKNGPEQNIASDYLIRVNRMPVAKDQVLQDGDRVTCTPLKVEGALPLRLS
jgi:hypothetical protein